MKIIPQGYIHYKPVLVQLLTWYQTGNWPLPESMMAQLIDAYLHHQASVS